MAKCSALQPQPLQDSFHAISTTVQWYKWLLHLGQLSDALLLLLMQNMEVCSLYVSLQLHERGEPRTSAVLWPSKAVETTLTDSEMVYNHIYMATTSPNGQWMAICSNRPEVLILSAVRTVQVCSGIGTELFCLWVPERITFCLQDNKEPPIQYVVSSPDSSPSCNDMEDDCTLAASWNASGNLLAVTSENYTRLTVFSMEIRQVVMQALCCSAQRGPPLGVRRQAGLKLEPTVQSGAAADAACRNWQRLAFSPSCCVGAVGTPCGAFLPCSGMASS